MKFKIATLLSLALLSCAHAEKKPNTLFFLVDDMGSLDPFFPFYYKGKEPVVTESNKLFSTPNMEDRASNGRLFTNAYAYSVCSPTRVTLLSDQAIPRHRVTTWTHPLSSKVDTGAIRTDKLTHFPHGLHNNNNNNNNLFTAFRKGRWKPIFSYHSEQWELYDLSKDIGETKSLVNKLPCKALDLAQIMLAGLKFQKAQFPIPIESKKPVLPDTEALQELIKQQKLADSDTYSPEILPFSAENRFEDPDWFNWGGSIIKDEDDKYYLFYSRWPKKNNFLAWLTHSEVAVASATKPSGPWTYQYTALKGRGGKHWDAVMAHNPKIKKFGNKYYLYYISTRGDLTEEELLATAKGGYRHKNWSPLRNNQRTGVAVSSSPQGPWVRQDKPLIQPEKPLHVITVNPAVTQAPSGKYIMMLKGDKFPRPGSPRIQAVATSEAPTGPFKVYPKPAISDFDTEDASIWYDKTRQRFYAMFHAHTYFGMITSTDGASWTKAKCFKFAKKSFLADDGSTFKAERMERPSVFTSAEGIPEVFISSYKKENATAILTIPMEH